MKDISAYNKHFASTEKGDYYTIYHRDENGIITDLNACGRPCQTEEQLHDFIDQLYSIGAFDSEMQIELCEAQYDVWIPVLMEEEE